MAGKAIGNDSGGESVTGSANFLLDQFKKTNGNANKVGGSAAVLIDNTRPFSLIASWTGERVRLWLLWCCHKHGDWIGNNAAV